MLAFEVASQGFARFLRYRLKSFNRFAPNVAITQSSCIIYILAFEVASQGFARFLCYRLKSFNRFAPNVAITQSSCIQSLSHSIINNTSIFVIFTTISYIYPMENSPELKALIRKNADLFWYIADDKKEDLPLEVVVEFFLNYAQQEDVKKLFEVVGIKKVAEVFDHITSISERRTNNILPINRNFYSLYFKRHA
jgi:hypothetical protein